MDSEQQGKRAKHRRATVIATPNVPHTRVRLQAPAPGRAGADAPEPAGIGEQLDTLNMSGLIRLAQAQPELEYLFRHALIQDAAYHSLVRDDRHAQHRNVAEVLERLYPDRLNELAAVLAMHFDEAGDDVRALQYYARAGDFALSRYANAEAVAHYTHALAVAKRTAPGQPLPLLHLYTARGRAYELGGHYEQALSNYSEMEAAAREYGDRSLELAALMARATIHSTPSAVHDPLRGKALSEQALAIARELADRQAESKILWNLMLLNQFTGHMRDAVNYGEQSLAIARELDLREQLAYTLNDIVRAYLGVGQFARARVVLSESRDIWRSLDNQPMLTDNLGRSARIYFAIGEYDRCIAAADEARRLSESIGNLWGQAFCRMFVGNVYFERGDTASAIETMSGCVRLAGQAGLVMALIGTRADLAWVYGTLGAIDEGLALSLQAKAIAEQRLPVFKPWATGSLARLQVLQGDLAAAERSVAEGYVGLDLEDLSTHGAALVPLADAELALARQDYAHVIVVTEGLIARLHKVGMRPFLADALYLKGLALLARGQSEAASDVLQEARAAAESLGSKRMLWQILAALSEIAQGNGSVAEAKPLRTQAADLITSLASHIPTNELRASFMQQAAVRAVMQLF